MWDSFLATLSPMLVMLLSIVVGFLLRKIKAAPENTATVLSKMEINVFLPALILRTFLTYCTVESISSRYTTILYGAIAIAVAVPLGSVLAMLFTKDKNEFKIYRYSLMVANFGFLGNAIVPAIMGQEMMYNYMLFTMPLNFVLYLWAFNSLIPEGKGEKTSILKNLLKPTCIAMAAGVCMGLLGVGRVLPDFVRTTLNNLAGCMAPVAMILTGFVIGGYPLGSLLKNKRVYIATALRLFVLPAVIVAVLWLLGADNSTLFMAMFAFASALGLNTVVVPAAYGGDTTTGAGMAMISHVGAIITIPLLYALLTTLTGGAA